MSKKTRSFTVQNVTVTARRYRTAVRRVRGFLRGELTIEGQTIFLLFLGLKLTGYIDWSWWWVAAPLWIPLAFIIFILAAVALFGAQEPS
jgi:hypothetical protein